MYINNQDNEQEFRKPMTFKELCVVFNAIQKANAKQAILAKDRAKTSLTKFELLNRYAQMGGVIRYKCITFTFDQDFGMGLLETPKGKVLGATLYDFFSLVNKFRQG